MTAAVRTRTPAPKPEFDLKEIFDPSRRTVTERDKVTHLARVLYYAMTTGWASLSLTGSYGRPSEDRLAGNFQPSGGIAYKIELAEGETLRLLITEQEYRQALRSLNTYYQSCIRAYYHRNPAKFDSCPSLKPQDFRADQRQNIQLQLAAFTALYHALIEPKMDETT